MRGRDIFHHAIVDGEENIGEDNGDMCPGCGLQVSKFGAKIGYVSRRARREKSAMCDRNVSLPEVMDIL